MGKRLAALIDGHLVVVRYGALGAISICMNDTVLVTSCVKRMGVFLT